jgi:hypothetical protein
MEIVKSSNFSAPLTFVESGEVRPILVLPELTPKYHINRPKIYYPQVAESIVRSIRAGKPMKTALAYAMVSRSMLDREVQFVLSEPAEDESIQLQERRAYMEALVCAIEIARGLYQGGLMDVIQNAAEGGEEIVETQEIITDGPMGREVKVVTKTKTAASDWKAAAHALALSDPKEFSIATVTKTTIEGEVKHTHEHKGGILEQINEGIRAMTQIQAQRAQEALPASSGQPIGDEEVLDAEFREDPD